MFLFWNVTGAWLRKSVKVFCFGLVLGGITLYYRGIAVLSSRYQYRRGHGVLPWYRNITDTAAPPYCTCRRIQTFVQKPWSLQPLQRRYIRAKNQFIDRVRSLPLRVNKLEVFKLNADDLLVQRCSIWLLTAEARLCHHGSLDVPSGTVFSQYTRITAGRRQIHCVPKKWRQNRNHITTTNLIRIKYPLSSFN